MFIRSTYIIFNIVYIIFLYWQLIFILSPEVGDVYSTYNVKNTSLSQNLVALVFAIIPSLIIKLKTEKMSEIIMGILYPMLYIPSMIFLFLTSSLDFPLNLLIGVTLMICFVLVIAMDRFPLEINIPRATPSLNIKIIYFFSTILFIVVILKLGSPDGWLDPTDVYDQRDIYNTKLGKMGAIWSYILIWTTYVIVPFLLSYSLNRKTYLIGAFAVAIQFFLYLHSGLKSTIFSIIIIPVAVYFIRYIKRVSYFWSLSICLLFVLSNSIYYIFNIKFMAVHFVRRLFITPGIHFGLYAEFFSENPFVFLSHSILSPFFTSPYELTPPHLMGQEYYNSADISANANMYADAFANFGIVGIIAFSFIILLILKLLDALSRGIQLSFLIPSSFSLIYALSNSSLLTVLLSYGLFLYMVLIYLTKPALQKL